MSIQKVLASLPLSSPVHSNVEKLQNALRNQFLLTMEGAHQLAISIFAFQSSIEENSAISIDPTDGIPYQLVITNTGIFPIKKENLVGQGTFSKVYRVEMITTHPCQLGDTWLQTGDVEQFALKVWQSNGSNTPTYSPEKRKLWTFLEPNQRGIDHYLSTFKIPLIAGFSVHKLFHCSLHDVNLDLLNPPVETLLKILISTLEGLSLIHKKGGIHRDIKGGNILVSITDQEISGVLTDFTFINSQATKLHRTIGTPEYLDPKQFGIEETLINQKKRKGIQTPSGDLFAFALTIVKDVLIKLINKKSGISKNSNEIKNLTKDLKETIAIGPFQECVMIQVGKSNPYRVMYRHESSNTPEKLIIYKSVKTFRDSLTLALAMLEDCFSSAEIKALVSLTHLSCDMQEEENRPDIDAVQKSLKEILRLLEQEKEEEKKKLEKKRSLENPDLRPAKKFKSTPRKLEKEFSTNWDEDTLFEEPNLHENSNTN